jgi:2,3-dihydroxybenzoate decarboxylase
MTPATGGTMQGKVILEEHFATPATLEDSRGFAAHVWDTLGPQLLDVREMRLPEMDKHGIEWMIVSLNAPAVQAIWDTRRAVAVAREANDILADECGKQPDRFVGVAALAMQDPDEAARELQRCVRELGFKGALVNGFSQVGDENTVAYYDLPQYRAFWKVVEELDVPFYLHPRNPLPAWVRIYDGHAWMMGPSWGFAAETAVHALRLIGSGLFDECPRLKIILGHLGEGIPFNLWRLDHRNEWMKKRHSYAAKDWVGDYMRRNFWVTTSGNFATPSLKTCMAELGTDRVMFSTDYPFENIAQSVEWFDNAEISEGDRQTVGRTNALNLFKLG